MILLILSLMLAQPRVSPIISMVNEYRVENHLQPVQVKEQACKFARVRAKEAYKDWSHDGFKARKKELDNTGYYWHENLAADYDKNREVIEAWKNSPTHKRNLLRDMNYACVARYKNVWAFEAMEQM